MAALRCFFRVCVESEYLALDPAHVLRTPKKRGVAYGGLRRSELLGLDWDDGDLDRRLIRVRNAKGGRQRVVPLHPGLVPLLLAYRDTRAPGDDPALFVGVLGNRLSPTILAATFRRYARAAGVDRRKRITPHTLRHVLPPSFSAQAQTCARSRSYSGTSTWTQRGVTHA